MMRCSFNEQTLNIVVRKLLKPSSIASLRDTCKNEFDGFERETEVCRFDKIESVMKYFPYFSERFGIEL